jgi:Uma2 family endonuclease
MNAAIKSWLPRHKFDVGDYRRMVECGILPGVRVELIEGQVIDPATSDGLDKHVVSRESKAKDAVSDSWIPYHPFAVDDYERMVEVGVLASDARVELIEGEVIDMAAMGSWHCGTVDWFSELFHLTVRTHANIRTQGAVRLSRFSQPEPDIALLRRRQDFYREAHPGASDTLLIVEVSDSSLRLDQEVKIPLYAHFCVPEVWVVDLVHERLHLYRSPQNGSYADVSDTGNPGLISLSAVPGLTMDLSNLFG